jgi:hypothetical protein
MRRVCLVLLMMGIAPPLLAQERASDVVQRAFAAMEQGRWAELAGYVDSTALAQFRREALQRAWSLERMPMMRGPLDPQLPPCVADYLKARQGPVPTGKDMGTSYRESVLLGAATPEELERLTPAEILGRAAKAHEERRIYGGVIPPRTQKDVVGEVLDNDSTALVLFKHKQYLEGRETGPRAVGVIALAFRRGAWKIIAPSQLGLYGGGGGIVYMESRTDGTE